MLLQINNSSRSHLFQTAPGLGELSVDVICHQLNNLPAGENPKYKIPGNVRYGRYWRPVNPRVWGHVGWSKENCTFPPIHEGRGPRRGGPGGRGGFECWWCIQCGWCKFEALLQDQNLTKAGRSACLLMQFVSEYFMVNKRFYK